MLDWLKPLPMMLYAPARGMALARDRAPLGAAALVALVAQSAYELYTRWPFVGGGLAAAAPFEVFGLLRGAAGELLLLALVFVPLLVLFANLFERRASFGLVLRQEFAPLGSAVFYGWSAAHLVALPLLWLSRRNGGEAGFLEQGRKVSEAYAARPDASPEAAALMLDPQFWTKWSALTIVLPLAAVWLLVAVREVLRLSWVRAAAVEAGAAVVMLVASPVLWVLMGLLSSPFLLFIFGFMVWGYFAEVMRTQRARASFRQNLEAATLNPADASAHYNLGLIHLSRKEPAEARERFKRAVEIDPEEVDAHYQLGRISRAEGKLSEAIEHFGQTVSRAPGHAQHEVWREIGATYIAAAQHADALDALDKFLERRPSDPEALYLRGRALAGVGRRREAAASMQACIEAVRTAPAYKYRTDKRWLNEAQQFLRTQA
jgi:cytochrome c-type biogenesis protein CcmH/NrfG